MKAVKITSGNAIATIDVGQPFNRSLRTIVGGNPEIVHPHVLPSPYCMVVGDFGGCMGKPTNLVGSVLHGAYKNGRLIAGDIVIMREELFGDGYALAGLSEQDAESLARLARDILDVQTAIGQKGEQKEIAVGKTIRNLTKEDCELLVWALKAVWGFKPLADSAGEQTVTGITVYDENPRNTKAVFTVEGLRPNYGYHLHPDFLAVHVIMRDLEYHEVFLGGPFNVQVPHHIVIDWLIRVGVIERLDWPDAGLGPSGEACPGCGSIDTATEEGGDRYCNACSRFYAVPSKCR